MESVTSTGLLTGSRSRKTEPEPTVDVTRMEPPCASARSLAMVRPSPVPPKRRVMPSLPWLKAPQILSRYSSLMPTPVSEMDSSTNSLSESSSTLRPTWPDQVNLAALPSRLCRICLMRRPSPRISGRSFATSKWNTTPFLRMALVSSITCAQISGSDTLSMTRRRESLRREAASRMSLTMLHSRWPDTFMVSSRSLTLLVSSPQLPAMMPSARPMMPTSGVRSSCDMAAKKFSFIMAASRRAWMVRSRSAATAACMISSWRWAKVLMEECMIMHEMPALMRKSKNWKPSSSAKGVINPP
mmetsp:Transcript_42643/g.114160  ORF Transcript_42643/g.114160 Transcript_42643/m.114160 type:complete len:300 (+) Transcript_42643:65-964(+)